MHPPPAGPAASVLPIRRERLAVISCCDALCGIAAYTRQLESQLGDLFEVTVFDLDQYLLRSSHSTLQRLGDRHIRTICRAIARFDAVNLQLEHGTLGLAAGDIARRFKWLVAAAPRLSVTFHSMYSPPPMRLAVLLKSLCRGRLGAAARGWSEWRRHRTLSRGIAARLRRAQRRKPVSVIVHNGADLKTMKYLHRIENTFEHPLAYLGTREAEAIRSTASRAHFPSLDALPSGSLLIGVFGFLSPYKGFETVIRALQHVPAHYHLLIFGGVHPNDIAARQPIHPYLSTLYTEAYVDTTLLERLAGASGSGTPHVSVTIDRSLKDLLLDHPKELTERIHFMGARDDEEFLCGMAICDIVVFPYLEVGQSSSGPISQALELGCRIIASRTRTFLRFARYHKDRIEFFDIGNHLELAQRLVARPQFAARRDPLDYTVETNKTVYFAANSAGATRASSAPPARRAAVARAGLRWRL